MVARFEINGHKASEESPVSRSPLVDCFKLLVAVAGLGAAIVWMWVLPIIGLCELLGI